MTPLERLAYRLNRAGQHGYVTMSASDLRAIYAIAGEARSGETVQQGSTGTAGTRAEGIAQQDTAHD